MPDTALSADQEALAQLLYDQLQAAFLDEARRLARLLASKADDQLLGTTEVQVREHVHRLGAKVLETTLNERKKGGTKGRA
jgi:hypothetical protein